MIPARDSRYLQKENMNTLKQFGIPCEELIAIGSSIPQYHPKADRWMLYQYCAAATIDLLQKHKIKKTDDTLTAVTAILFSHIMLTDHKRRL